jgi:hypothetical protein
MIRLFVRHEVSNYTAWRKRYDAFNSERRSLGVTSHAVYRSVERDTDITVTHDFGTLAEAKAFVSSPRVREVMAAAGVKGQSTFWFAQPD